MKQNSTGLSKGGNKIEACPGRGGGGGGGIYKSVPGDIKNACAVVLNPEWGGVLFAIVVIHRGVLLDNGIPRQLLPALHGYLC